MISRASDSTEGSSPLTRGKRDQVRHREIRVRLIPAHAGKTIFGFPRSSSPRAHPRSRGENRIEARPYQRVAGSSPLTRGKPCPREGMSVRARLIPAHAGKTPSQKSKVSRSRAHPRSRGENSWLPSCVRRFAGSSPLTRGKLQRIAATATSARLIPAHAGKTSLGKGLSPVIGAHPRSRGENHVFDVGGREYSGSSPLTRGKPWCALSWLARLGLIPAHAGKTYEAHALAIQTGAHPRSRGEN